MKELAGTFSRMWKLLGGSDNFHLREFPRRQAPAKTLKCRTDWKVSIDIFNFVESSGPEIFVKRLAICSGLDFLRCRFGKMCLRNTKISLIARIVSIASSPETFGVENPCFETIKKPVKNWWEAAFS
ncbi:hypothetical protein [Flavobacterium sp.]|uniref:hypothetical protein n=1 Tax=Flavobacterium sp. TaxID=239 RepID=UPI0011FB40E7|nr:hypothetical protein [Flavobacterium sp.]RZJ69096.1 MAG: hypothetical protein EOO49_18540 [Flavobacterium sp.]